MTYRAHVINGRVVLDDGKELPEGAEVRVELSEPSSGQSALEENGQTLGEKLLEFAGAVKGLPTDLARNHDHYLHGTPKK